MLRPASVAMLFLGMTSAYVRERLGQWTEISMPPLMLVNTAILLASSFAFEKSRRALSLSGNRTATANVEAPAGFTTWLFATLALGLLFLAGQVAAWQQLSRTGIYLSTSPHSSSSIC